MLWFYLLPIKLTIFLYSADLIQAVVSWAAFFCFVYSSAISLGFTFVKYIQAWL